ncbi:MAG TPA: metallophosphoesterase [Terracidiphilus sp.]|nr:metallophosphoesterase [Terracidiphilus sp.]
MSTNEYGFANPTMTADNFFTYSAGEIAADAALKEEQVTEPIPAPRVEPPVMDLSAVLPASAIAAIQEAGQLVFHAVGDTGGVVKAEPQLAVADTMAADLNGKTYATGLPAFFFHLGDVVYYFGQQEYYPEQFYDPYRNYNGPIFAIPGNHDGVLYKNEPVPYSLSAFIDNFCAATPVIGASGFARTTMTQPGAYFVFTAPFVRVIGLYSNTGESVGVLSGGVIGNDQITFLQQQLAAALAARNADTANKNPQALILTVHHPPFTGASDHFPSASMLQAIDACCQQAGIWPDLVLSGHAHLYERYTRTMKADGRQIAYIVAGNGGYYNLSKLKTNAQGEKPTPGQQTEPDGQGNTITLEQFNDSSYGFLRVTVNATSIEVEALGVSGTSTTTSPASPVPAPTLVDHFVVNLGQHTVTTEARGKTHSTSKRDKPETDKHAKGKKKEKPKRGK